MDEKQRIAAFEQAVLEGYRASGATVDGGESKALAAGASVAENWSSVAVSDLNFSTTDKRFIIEFATEADTGSVSIGPIIDQAA